MKIEWNKKNTSLVMVHGIIAALIILVFAVIPFHKDSNSWTAMVFTVVALTVSCTLTLYAFSSRKNLTSRFYGFPIAKMGWIYAVLQTLISLIVIIVSIFTAIPSWIIWLLSLILLGFTVIGSIAADNAREIVEEEDTRVKRDTQKVKLFTADMSGISDSCKDAETRKMIEKLAEKFRYSDPVSSEATEEIEHIITEMISSLRLEIAEGDKEKVQNRIQNIQNTLAERNRICKLSK